MSAKECHKIEWPEHFANLVLGSLQLLIPQSDIYSLEPAIDMIENSTQKGYVGQIEQSGTIWPLYALAPDLTILSKWPEHYRIAILIKNVDPLYGLVCENVYTLERCVMNIQAIPTAMIYPQSPLLALAIYEEKVRCISSAKDLSQLFQQGTI